MNKILRRPLPRKSAFKAKIPPAHHARIEQGEVLAKLQRFAREKGIVSEIQSGHSAFRSRHHQTIRAELARLYSIGWFLREDCDTWFDFCRDSAWGTFKGRPKEVHREDALRFVIRMAVGFDGRRSTNLVHKYYKRLQGFFDSQVSPKDAVEKIMRGKRHALITNHDAARETKAQSRTAYATILIPLDKGGETLLGLHAQHVALSLKITREGRRSRTAHLLKFMVRSKRPKR